jgi:membrane protein YqaA with SNARE-associated domain
MRRPAAPGDGRPGTPALALAAAWGLAEATVFFIVPDVLLSRLALRGWRPMLLACLAATAGAVGGGALVHGVARAQPEPVLRALDRVPAVSADMIRRAGEDLARRGGVALAAGALTATPYKVFAAQAGRLRQPLGPFLAASALARLGRFLAVCLLAMSLAGALRAGGVAERTLGRVHAGAWTVFYAGFFWAMPG